MEEITKFDSPREWDNIQVVIVDPDPKYVTEVLTFWLDNLPMKKGWNYTSKSYRESVDTVERLVRGTMFISAHGFTDENRKFSVEEIKESIQRFSISCLDPDYYPPNKSVFTRLSFPQFVYNRFLTSENLFFKSLFLHFLKNKPKRIGFGRPVDYPLLIDALKSSFIKFFYSGILRNWSSKENDDFTTASEYLNGTIEKVSKIRTFYVSGKRKEEIWADDLMKAVKEGLEIERGYTISTLVLTKKWLYEDFFIRRLISRGILNKSDVLGIQRGL